MSQADKSKRNQEKGNIPTKEESYILVNHQGLHYSGTGDNILQMYMDLNVQLISKVFGEGLNLEQQHELIDQISNDLKAGTKSLMEFQKETLERMENEN